MQTATSEVKAVHKTKGEDVILLLDSGSHKTYVTEDLAERLGLKEKSHQEIHTVTFGSKNTKSVKTKATIHQMKLKNRTYMSVVADLYLVLLEQFTGSHFNL